MSGGGLQTASWNEYGGASSVTPEGERHSALIKRVADSSIVIRSPIGGSVIPYIACSSSCQPAPRPSTKRPPETWSMVAPDFAVSAGCR